MRHGEAAKTHAPQGPHRPISIQVHINSTQIYVSMPSNHNMSHVYTKVISWLQMPHSEIPLYIIYCLHNEPEIPIPGL